MPLGSGPFGNMMAIDYMQALSGIPAVLMLCMLLISLAGEMQVRRYHFVIVFYILAWCALSSLVSLLLVESGILARSIHNHDFGYQAVTSAAGAIFLGVCLRMHSLKRLTLPQSIAAGFLACGAMALLAKTWLERSAPEMGPPGLPYNSFYTAMNESYSWGVAIGIASLALVAAIISLFAVRDTAESNRD